MLPILYSPISLQLKTKKKHCRNVCINTTHGRGQKNAGMGKSYLSTGGDGDNIVSPHHSLLAVGHASNAPKWPFNILGISIKACKTCISFFSSTFSHIIKQLTIDMNDLDVPLLCTFNDICWTTLLQNQSAECKHTQRQQHEINHLKHSI